MTFRFTGRQNCGMVRPMMQFVGQITVTLLAAHRRAAESRLHALARELGACFSDVLYADHRGEVEPSEPVRFQYSGLRLVSGLPACFDAYEIHGVIQATDDQGDYLESVDDAEAERWCLYGHVPGRGLLPIGEYPTREQAETIYAAITGRIYSSHCSPAKTNSAA